MSVPERLDLLCRTDREVALRAAARYIDLLLHHLVNVYVCAFSLILLLSITRPRRFLCAADNGGPSCSLFSHGDEEED